MNIQNDAIIDILKYGDKSQLINYLRSNKISYSNILYKIIIDYNKLNLLNILYDFDDRENKKDNIIEQLHYYNLLNPNIFIFLTEENQDVFFNEYIGYSVKQKIIDGCIYNNSVILTLLLHAKNKNPISKIDLNHLIFDKKILTIFNQSCRSYYNNSYLVDYLIHRKLDINGYDKNGKTALIVACENGFEDLAKYLINHGADINKPDEDGNTPLITACSHFDKNLISFLIDNNEDLNTIDKDGSSPLIVDCQNVFNSNLVETIVEYGADINAINHHGTTALMKACGNNGENIEDFINNHRNEIMNQDPTKFPLLLLLYNQRNETIIKFLVEHGANINIIDNNGNTAVMLAHATGKRNITEYLIKNGANFNKDIISLTISEDGDLNYENRIKILYKYLIIIIFLIIIFTIIIFIIIILFF